MGTEKPNEPGLQPPKESEVERPDKVEFAPPGEVEWKAAENAPDEFRPPHSPEADPVPREENEEWRAPERTTAPRPDEEKTRE